MRIWNTCILTSVLYSLSYNVLANKHDEGEGIAKNLRKLRNQLMISKQDYQQLKTIIVNKNSNADRVKRTPCHGRVRKEIRRLTPKEWRIFTEAINVLKQTGEYNVLAAIHRGKPRINAAHFGPNFLGWHRVYVLCLEELLRNVEPCVTIPYWDSTLDYRMENPTWSILWTEAFLGNGNGYVRTGPFNNWITSEGDYLTRNTGSKGNLLTDDLISRIFSRTSIKDIIDLDQGDYNIEQIHGGVHSWVDGQMSVLASASEDPVFFLLHSFVDCLWQWFIDGLKKSKGIDQYDDYLNVTGAHAPNNLMDPFASLNALANITNREGYRLNLNVFTCEPRPTCSRKHPYCHSRYLRCNTKTEKCISVPGDWSKTGPPKFDEHPPIRKGLQFFSKSIDPRIRNDPLPQRLPEDNHAERTALFKKMFEKHSHLLIL